MSWLKYLNPLKPIGDALTGASKAKAEQRASAEEMEMDREALRQSGERSYLDALFKREDERRASAGDAFKRLQQYDFINQGGTKTPMLSPYSKQVQGAGPLAQELSVDSGIIHELMQRASYADPLHPSNPGYADTVLRRLALPGSDTPPNVYEQMEKHMRPGKGEQAAGWLGALFGGSGGSGGSYSGRYPMDEKY